MTAAESRAGGSGPSVLDDGLKPVSLRCNAPQRTTGAELAAMSPDDFARFVRESGVGTVTDIAADVPTPPTARASDLAGDQGTPRSRDEDREPSGSPVTSHPAPPGSVPGDPHAHALSRGADTDPSSLSGVGSFGATAVGGSADSGTARTRP